MSQGFVPNKERIIELLRQQHGYLASEFGVSTISLFGSFAKDHAGEASDIDIIVEFHRPIGLRFVELAEYLEGLLGRKVDILTPTGLSGSRHRVVAKHISESAIHV